MDGTFLCLITQPAAARAISLAELQLRIYGQKGLVRWMKYKLMLALVG